MSERLVFCERAYTVLRNGEPLPAIARWMRPEPDQNDWRCEWSLTIGDNAPVWDYAMGVDSTQALVLALSIASVKLHMLAEPIFWFEEGDDLGLPTNGQTAADLRAERAARHTYAGSEPRADPVRR
ncbi:MAG: hypothetical protein JSR45_07235 [Proteobacteria bacterium]|nr:hypothetical protein [Pseudomonadota bacterium]